MTSLTMQSVAIWEFVAVTATFLIISSMFFVLFLRQDRPPWAHTSTRLCWTACMCAGVLLLASIVLDRCGRRDNARIYLVCCQLVVIALVTWFINLEILFALGGWWGSHDLGWRKTICLLCPLFQLALIVTGIVTYALHLLWAPWLFWSIPLPSWLFLCVLGGSFILKIQPRKLVSRFVISIVALLLSATIFALTICLALRNPAHFSLLCLISYIVQFTICATILILKVISHPIINRSRENTAYETTTCETGSHQPGQRDILGSESRSSSSLTLAGDGSRTTSINSDRLPPFGSPSDSSSVTLANHSAKTTSSKPEEITTDRFREGDWSLIKNLQKLTVVEFAVDDSPPAFTITSSGRTLVLDCVGWPRPASGARLSPVTLTNYGSDLPYGLSQLPNESQVYMRILKAEMDRAPNKRPVRDVLDVGFGNGDCAIEIEARHPEAQITTTEPVPILAERCRYIPYDKNTGHWPFEENSYDLAIIRGTGECINNPGELFRNVSGSVRPGGCVEFWGLSLPRTATDWLNCSKKIRAFHSPSSLTDDGACQKEMEAAGLSLVSVSKKCVTLEKSNTQDLGKELLSSTIVKIQKLEKQRLLKVSDHDALPRRMKEIQNELLEAPFYINAVIGKRPGKQENTGITWHSSASYEYYNSLCKEFLEPRVDGYSTYV
ncbi:unnamed protein product [Clonostachys chloroleuca]|uniref:Uncharacterized protein n=1 Tax=Clonostachys chloroleuca TaxID=1926264 RepID=A0AA35PUS7_9HYPO|nr:unnamed protein product [Clonostachys chloroleuca]